MRHRLEMFRHRVSQKAGRRVQSGEHIAGYQPLGQSTRSYQRDERPGAVRTRQPPFRRRRTAHRESTRQRGQEDVHRLHRPRLRALSSNPRVGQAPERLAVPGVCQRLRRHGDSPGGVDGSTVWLRMILNRPDASTKLAAPVFTSWVLQLASLQQSRGLSASLQPPLPVFAPPASA